MLVRKLLGVVLAVVSSCHLVNAQDRPNHTDAVNQIRRENLSDNRFFAITHLTYVNGFEKDRTNYIVATTFTREFKVSSKEFYGEFNKVGTAAANDVKRSKPSEDDLGEILGNMGTIVSSGLTGAILKTMFGQFESGDRFDEQCQFRFLRTENGWIFQGPEGDESVVARHTEHYDAATAQAAQQAKAYADTYAETDAKAKALGFMFRGEFGRRLVEGVDVCASGRPMYVNEPRPLTASTTRDGKITLSDDQTWNPSVGYPVLESSTPRKVIATIHDGQVVVGTPDPHAPKGMCHIEYTEGNRTISGYVSDVVLTTKK